MAGIGATPGKESENGVYEFPYMRPQNNRTKWENFQLLIWDSSERKFLGRTAESWAKILLYYICLYIILAAIFTICMQVLFLTLDENEPKYKLQKSLIGTNPGLGFRPISDRTEEGSLIWYNTKDKRSIEKWVNLTDKYLELYLNKLSGNEMNRDVCRFGKDASAGKVCTVDTNEWGPCSQENGYGFAQGSPCFFLKLNKIFDWIPEFYNNTDELPEDMPLDLKEHIIGLEPNQRNQVWVSCKGENPADRETIGPSLLYFPTRGFPYYYFPFRNSVGYLSPLVAVQVVRPTNNILINIECRSWAKNIIYRGGNQQREGSVHLEIMVD